MKTLITTLLLALVPIGSLSAREPFACNMLALTKSERATHQKLSRTLFAAIQEKRELPNGYAFRLPAATLVKAAQWVALEGRCCPFFTFQIDVAKNEGPLWLRVTGSEGIKPFIRAEFQLD